MPRLEWDKTGERLYETGVDRGVCYPQASGGTYPSGEAWNGLTSVSENPTGGEPNALWADNLKYATLMSAEEFEATVEAYTYPDCFAECNGEKEIATGVTIGQQARKPFGFSYRTLIGNDVNGTEHGYKIHLVYGALASPSERTHDTVNDSPDAETMSWDVTTTPVAVTGAKPTAHLVIDSTKTTPEKLATLETALYGGDSTEARLPLPDEVKTMMA
jgi:hypothetical protein